MFFRRIIIFLSVAALISGCAYFNMYFNAKQNFNDAEKKRKETSIVDKALYENSIKELSKILEFYPDSKWVDDALLMMGLCYFRQEDNYKAQKKFNELLLKYPDSELADQARMHLAEVEIAMKNYEEAGKLLERIQTGDIDIEPFRLLKLNAEMSLSQGDSVKALEFMLKAADKAESAPDKISLLQFSAELSAYIRDFKMSADINKDLIELYAERDKKFNAIINYAEALKQLGDTDEAIKILEEVTGNEEYAQYSLKGEIKLAKLYTEEKLQEKAYNKLDEILRVNPKDRNNGPDLAETAYYFGEYYFNLLKDFKSAETMYDSCGFFDRKNEFYTKSLERMKQIREYRSIRDKVESYPQKIDSLNAKIARIRSKMDAADMSADGRDAINDEIGGLAKERKDLKTSYVNEKSTLAEKARFEMNLPDTSRTLFQELADESDYPHKASYAMVSLILDDSVRYGYLTDSVLIKYPATAGANYIRISRGQETIQVVEDSAKYFFNLASDKFIDSLYSEASEQYIEIARKYEKNPISPKILQAAAMINEKYLKDFSKAAELYAEIKEKYSQTVYGRYASMKIKQEGEEVRKDEKKKKIIIPESDIWYQMDRRNN